MIEKVKRQYPELRYTKVTHIKSEGLMLFDKDTFVAILQYNPDTKSILELQVSEKYRRKGVATDLLSHAISKGINKLSVNKSNDSAISLYRKFGYEVTGEDDRMYYMKYNKKDGDKMKLDEATFGAFYDNLSENKILDKANGLRKRGINRANIIRVKVKDITPKTAPQLLTKLRSLIYKRDFETIYHGDIDPITITRQIILVGGSLLITPWLTIPTFFIDQLIESKINEKEVTTYINKMTKERDKLKDEIKKQKEKDGNPETIKNLTTLKDNVEMGINNLEDYREKVESNKVRTGREKKEMKKAFDDDEGFDDDLDLDDMVFEAIVDEIVGDDIFEVTKSHPLDIKTHIGIKKSNLTYRFKDANTLRATRSKLKMQLSQLQREKRARINGGINLIKPIDKGIKRKAVDSEISRLEKAIEKIDNRLSSMKDKVKPVKESYDDSKAVKDLYSHIIENAFVELGNPLDLSKLKASLTPGINSIDNYVNKYTAMSSEVEVSEEFNALIEALNTTKLELMELRSACEVDPTMMESILMSIDIFEDTDLMEDIEDYLDGEDLDFVKESLELFNENIVDKGLDKVSTGARRVTATAKKVSRTVKRPIKRVDKGVSKSVDGGFDNLVDKVKKELVGETQDEVISGKVFKLSKLLKRGILAGAGMAVAPVLTLITLITGLVLKGRVKDAEKEKILNLLKGELEVVDEKIRDADSNGDKEAKYKLMRVRNKLRRDIDRIRYNIDPSKYDIKSNNESTLLEEFIYEDELLEGSLKSKILDKRNKSGETAKKIKDFLNDDTLVDKNKTSKDKLLHLTKLMIFAAVTPGGIIILSTVTIKKMVDKFKSFDFDKNSEKDMKKIKSIYNSTVKAISKSKNKEVIKELESLKLDIEARYPNAIK